MVLVSEELKTLEAMMRKGEKKCKVCSSKQLWTKIANHVENIIAKEDN